MPKLPVVSSKNAIKAAQNLGFRIVRQRGSHVMLKNMQGKRLIIPNHKVLKPGTLLEIIKMMGLTKEKFIDML